MNQHQNAGLLLCAQWERAVERAINDIFAPDEPMDAALNDAAGLHVQSGLQAGAWTHTCSCNLSYCCPQ